MIFRNGRVNSLFLKLQNIIYETKDENSNYLKIKLFVAFTLIQKVGFEIIIFYKYERGLIVDKEKKKKYRKYSHQEKQM